MKVLLHTCCGPCASACVPRLREAGHDVALFYSNSNIDCAEEFARRQAAAEALARAEGVALVTDAYDHARWLREVAAGLEGEPEKDARCAKCFRFSLARTAAYAAAHGFDAFATSLTVSPHKVSSVVFAQGDAVAPDFLQAGLKFLPADFKKKEGFKLSVRRAAELGLYRQSYCGCEFSKRAGNGAMSAACFSADRIFSRCLRRAIATASARLCPEGTTNSSPSTTTSRPTNG